MIVCGANRAKRYGKFCCFFGHLNIPSYQNNYAFQLVGFQIIAINLLSVSFFFLFHIIAVYLLFFGFLGLEVLISTDERFRNYKNDLFSHKSRELDRDLMSIEENNLIDASISSYLRLLSGYLQLPPSQRTLEYLIRRYK